MAFLDPAVYPFFDVYPVVEQYIPTQPSEQVPQVMPLVTPKEHTGTKFGYPVINICKRFFSQLRTHVTSACRRCGVPSLGYLPEGLSLCSRNDGPDALALGLPSVRHL